MTVLSRATRARAVAVPAALATLSAGLVAGGSMMPAAAVDVPAPLVHYEFDADDLTTGTITDSSGNGLDGALVNGASAALVDGADGGLAIDLPGGAPTSSGAYVRLPRQILDGATDLTVSTRIRWDGTTAPWQWIYALGTNTTRYLFSTPYNGDGRLRTAVTTSGGGGEAQVTGSAALPAQGWKTVTVTLDTTTDRITTYLDGAAVASAATTIGAGQLLDATAMSAGFIGRSFYQDPLFAGAVDDFQVHRQALSADQVAEAFGETVPTATGLAQDTFDVRTSVGTAPALPASVRATFTDGYDRDLPIHWDTIDPADYADRGEFTVTGTAGNWTVTATVTVIREELVVDLDNRTGDFFGAGGGTLYGLSDEGVPSDNTLEPLRIHSVAQKPPAGAQHPNGDSLVVAEPFFRTGGEYIQIYVQDMYEFWTYENPGGVIPCNQVCFDDFMEKLAWVVDQASSSPHADRFVYVPWNEPDNIWYGLGTGNTTLYQQRMAVFLDHWRTAVEYIRAHHPGARVMAINDATFRARNYGDFLTFARDNDVLPDIVSWHQLASSSLDPASSNYFRNTYQTYRNLERERGIDPIPININEYAGNRDLTVPGQLVQWVAMFEEAKVAAGGKAYWTAAGGLAGDVVETNKPGGGWWFYKMYADMSGGDTVKVTRPDTTSLDALDAIAVVDDDRRQARIVAGGTGDDFDVVIDNINGDLFGETVHVTLSATTWSGQNSDAPPPAVLLEDDLTPEDGSLTVPVRGLGVHGDGGPNIDRMAAYEIVLSPGGTGTRQGAQSSWRAAYEAENATITAGQAFTQGTAQNWNTAAASGNRDVGALNQPNSAVTFDVDVPAAGEYRLSIMYGNQTGQPSQQALTVNGGQPQFVDYQATLTWLWRTRKDVVIELQEGENQIRLGKSHPDVGTAVAEATLDRIDLELITSHEPVTRQYEAEHAQSEGTVDYEYDHPQQSGAGHVTLHRGAETTFVVYAEEDGHYDLRFRYFGPGRPGTAAGRISLDRRLVDGAVLPADPGGSFWDVGTERLFLSAGVNRVTVEQATNTPLRLDGLSVTRATSGPQPGQAFEAEDAALAGSAAVENHTHASGGQYVSRVGQGPQNRLTFDVDVAEAGDYMLVVHYANDERELGHPYNADIISRPIDVSVNGGDPTRHWFKNTWSWGNFWARGIPVTLEAGTNTIAMFNDPANSATATGCPTPCRPVLDSEWAPNLDRFELARVRATL